MTDYSTLTDAELSERVALVCGWTQDDWTWWYPPGDVDGMHFWASPIFASDLNAVFGPHGPAQWLKERGGRWRNSHQEVMLWSGPLAGKDYQITEIVPFRNIPNCEARAFCEAFLAVVEVES